MFKTKTDFSPISVERLTRDRINNLRNGMEPRMPLYEFIAKVVEYYELRHCIQCGKDLSEALPTHCNCTDTERT